MVLPEATNHVPLRRRICAERGIATCVLLGNPDEINRVAASQGVELGAGIEIVNPEVVRESYVAVWLSCVRTKASPKPLRASSWKTTLYWVR
ncbi:phosphate acyltransferase [Shigella flexneri]